MPWVPRRLTVGVLGGMGPVATIDFMAKVAAATPAGFDQEHVPLIVHNVPQIPDRSSAIIQGDDGPFLPMLAGVRMLERNGVDLVAIPCNTAHFWYDRLARSCAVRIVHIADAVADAINASSTPPRRVALLATRGTIHAEIYQARLARVVDLVAPDEATQATVDRVIAAVKAGDLTNARALATALDGDLAMRGFDRLLLACTELPVAFAGVDGTRVIDATDALARACVKASLGAEVPPKPVTITATAVTTASLGGT